MCERKKTLSHRLHTQDPRRNALWNLAQKNGLAGLAAHYFEEIENFPPMRRINFAEAMYKGKAQREYLQ